MLGSSAVAPNSRAHDKIYQGWQQLLPHLLSPHHELGAGLGTRVLLNSHVAITLRQELLLSFWMRQPRPREPRKLFQNQGQLSAEAKLQVLFDQHQSLCSISLHPPALSHVFNHGMLLLCSEVNIFRTVLKCQYCLAWVYRVSIWGLNSKACGMSSMGLVGRVGLDSRLAKLWG